ncbi:hypothetical protein SBA5_190031 [Candidatus Sulfotelmatomonas gaucii]|uniref:Uncharacterized protein n=1 Tax=Candidatus Sulfuritelmatomonas gaucii TaxID=2043161 RepID=A0A2N9L7L2_9BACT|nr:hypothetical protein SBA5_190031 [Candidatus Sulfotelmatomonas gaucii]
MQLRTVASRGAPDTALRLMGNYLQPFRAIRNLRGCHLQFIRHLEGSLRRKFATSGGYI